MVYDPMLFGLVFVMISIILFKLTMAILWSMRWHLRSLLAMKIILTTFLAYKSFVGELIFIVSALKASQLLNWPSKINSRFANRMCKIIIIKVIIVQMRQ